MIGKIASFQIQNLLVAYKERFDKDNFIKNLLLDNLLLVDIYNRAKKLHIDIEVRRVVFIVETNREKDGNELEKIRSLFGGKSKDFVTAVDEKNIIVVKELAENETYDDLRKTAEVILNLFRSEADGVHIAYGTVINELKEVSRSYKEARMALDVGKIFFEERNIIAYSQLGIGRLIYQLPIPLCKMFIKEIFDGKSPDDFDEEILWNQWTIKEKVMIKLEHVSKAYSAGIPALNDVNLEIDDGEFVFVCGDSGSGKSTLIKLLLKELDPTDGTITVDGRNLTRIRHKQVPKYRRNVGVVFQDFRLLKDRNVYENVAFALKVIGASTVVIKKKVPQMLSMVGLAAKYKSKPRELSGGEQQRVRAIVNEPPACWRMSRQVISGSNELLGDHEPSERGE